MSATESTATTTTDDSSSQAAAAEAGAKREGGKQTFLTAVAGAVDDNANGAGQVEEAHDLRMDRVREEYGEMNKVIEAFNSKVTAVMAQQQEEYLKAYRAHVYNIQRELYVLRRKVKSMQNNQKKEEKLAQLHQELDWYRKEAIRLDGVTGVLRQALRDMKDKVEHAEQDRNWLLSRLSVIKRQYRALGNKLTTLRNTLPESAMAELDRFGDLADTASIGDRSDSSSVVLSVMRKNHGFGEMDPINNTTVSFGGRGGGGGGSAVGVFDETGDNGNEDGQAERGKALALTHSLPLLPGVGGAPRRAGDDGGKRRARFTGGGGGPVSEEQIVAEQMQADVRRLRKRRRDLVGQVVAARTRKAEIEEMLLHSIQDAESKRWAHLRDVPEHHAQLPTSPYRHSEHRERHMRDTRTRRASDPALGFGSQNIDNSPAARAEQGDANGQQQMAPYFEDVMSEALAACLQYSILQPGNEQLCDEAVLATHAPMLEPREDNAQLEAEQFRRLVHELLQFPEVLRVIFNRVCPPPPPPGQKADHQVLEVVKGERDLRPQARSHQAGVRIPKSTRATVGKGRSPKRRSDKKLLQRASPTLGQQQRLTASMPLLR